MAKQWESRPYANFRKVFAKFSRFSDAFERVWTGWMRSDASECISVRSKAFGHLRNFLIFPFFAGGDFVSFWMFFAWFLILIFYGSGG